MSSSQVRTLLGDPDRRIVNGQSEEWYWRTYRRLVLYHFLGIATFGFFYVIPPTWLGGIYYESHKVVLWKGIVMSYGKASALSPIVTSRVSPELPPIAEKSYRLAEVVSIRDQWLRAALKKGVEAVGWKESPESKIVMLFAEQTGNQVVHVPPTVVWKTVNISVPGQSFSGSVQTNKGSSSFEGQTGSTSTSTSVPVTVPGYETTMTIKTLSLNAFTPDGKPLWEGYCSWDVSQYPQDPGELFIAILGFGLGADLAPPEK